jgi:hypothetical protein
VAGSQGTQADHMVTALQRRRGRPYIGERVSEPCYYSLGPLCFFWFSCCSVRWSALRDSSPRIQRAVVDQSLLWTDVAAAVRGDWEEGLPEGIPYDESSGGMRRGDFLGRGVLLGNVLVEVIGS